MLALASAAWLTVGAAAASPAAAAPTVGDIQVSPPRATVLFDPYPYPAGGPDTRPAWDRFIEMAYVVPPTVHEPDASANWALARPYVDASGTGFGTGMPAIWDAGRADGNGVTVAVIDTGIHSHPEFAAQLLPGFDFVSDKALANDGDGWDPDPTDPGGTARDPDDRIPCGTRTSGWHGTQVTSIIASAANNNQGTAGTAPNARILPVRALGPCGGRFADVIAALRWSAGLDVPGVPPNPHPADVINLSISTSASCTGIFAAPMAEVLSTGAIVVGAAGNAGSDAGGYFPANCPGVLAVAAGTPQGTLAVFSNFAGPAFHGDLITAPGVGVRALTVDSTGAPVDTFRVASFSGTSAATPVAAGAIATLLSQGADDPVGLLLTHATSPRTLGASPQAARSCRQGACGAGFVNIAAASHALDPFDDLGFHGDAPIRLTRAGPGRMRVTWAGGTGHPESAYAAYPVIANDDRWQTSPLTWGASPSVAVDYAPSATAPAMRMRALDWRTGQWTRVGGPPRVQVAVGRHTGGRARITVASADVGVPSMVRLRYRDGSGRWRAVQVVARGGKASVTPRGVGAVSAVDVRWGDAQVAWRGE